MNSYPSHDLNLVALRRIEGQIRGIQKMICERKYCVDILNQIHAVISALTRVEDKILERHFAHCVKNTVNGKSQVEKQKRLNEILSLIHQFRKV